LKSANPQTAKDNDGKSWSVKLKKANEEIETIKGQRDAIRIDYDQTMKEAKADVRKHNKSKLDAEVAVKETEHSSKVCTQAYARALKELCKLGWHTIHGPRQWQIKHYEPTGEQMIALGVDKRFI
jgi:predicted phage tail protein